MRNRRTARFVALTLVNKFSIRDRHARATAGWLAGEATIIAIAACLKARESCG
jgi:hypothetical protein